MTGIEMLRKLSEDLLPYRMWDVLDAGTEEDWDCEKSDGKTLSGTIDAIAAQIEREQDVVARVDWEVVRDVRDEMARYVFGVPKFDKLVDDWVRKLDGALDGRRRDAGADIVHSGNMEVQQWVRDYGGLEAVHRMFQDADNRRIELCAALGIDLAKGWSEAMATLRFRQMPEGYVWLRYEDGSFLKYGDPYIGNDGNIHIAWQIRFDSYANVHVSRSGDGDGFGTRWDHFNKGERVKRPIQAADGELMEVGQTVWHVVTGREYVVVEPAYGETVVVRLAKCEDAEGEQYPPDQLTHTKPESIDSWERIEEDAKKEPCEYFGYAGKPCDGCLAFDLPDDCGSVKGAEIVRRCRALAAQERGE